MASSHSVLLATFACLALSACGSSTTDNWSTERRWCSLTRRRCFRHPAQSSSPRNSSGRAHTSSRGADAKGDPSGLACNDWTDTTRSSRASAGDATSPSDWLFADEVPCDGGFVDVSVYCFEQ